MTTPHLEDLAGAYAGLVRKREDDRHHMLRLQRRVQCRRQNALRQPRGGEGCDHVHAYVVARAFDRQCLREPHETRFRGGVVGLSEVAEESGAGAGHHDAPVVRRSQMRPGGACHEKGALEVDIEHRIPLRGRHLVEGGVPQDSCVVHEYVEAAVMRQGLSDDAIGVEHGGRDRKRGGTTAAHRIDQRLRFARRTLRRRHVVDDHMGAPFRERERVGAA